MSKPDECHCKCFVVEEVGCGKPGDGTVDLSDAERGTVPARWLTVEDLNVAASFWFDGETWQSFIPEEREDA